MDVHRVRFVEHIPQPIHCLAFSRGDSGSQRLALSRGDGSIEIWASNGGEHFYKELWVPGRSDVSIEALVWCGKRLFYAGLTGAIHECDLLRLKPSTSVDSCGGAVWCMALNSSNTCLAAGCEDGQVRLFDISLDTLSFIRGLDKQEGRVLSLAWHSSGNHLATGGADSILRKMNVKTGRCELRITLDEFKSRSTLVWDLKFLSDSTIVSADSLGKVQLWNSKHGTLVQSFQLHLADVLTLAVNREENEIYSSGIDQKVVCIRKVKAKGGRWVKSGEVRAHSHDVRTLALSQDGLLASGGVDTQLVVCPTSSFDVHSCVKHHPFTDSSHFFSVAPKANVLMHRSNTSLKFWQLSSQGSSPTRGISSSSPQLPNGGSEAAANSSMESRGEKSASESSEAVPDSDISIASDSLSMIPFSHCTNGVPVNFLEIKSKGHLHILSSAISQDATLVALSNVDQFWLYSIEHEALKVRCVKNIDLPCYKMEFTPDGNMLVLATIKEGVKIATPMPDFDLDALRTLESKKSSSSNGLVSKHPVMDFQLSPNGSMIATINSRKRISVYSLSSCQLLNKLARLEAQPVLFAFHNSKPELILFAGGPERGMYTYDIQDEHLHFAGLLQLDQKQSSRNKLLFPNSLFAVPFKSGLFALYDGDCMTLVRCGSTDRHEKTNVGKKRKRNLEQGRLRHQYVRSNPLVLFASSLGDQQLVVVEQSWSQVLQELPPALARDRYGT